MTLCPHCGLPPDCIATGYLSAQELGELQEAIPPHHMRAMLQAYRDIVKGGFNQGVTFGLHGGKGGGITYTLTRETTERVDKRRRA